MFYKELLNEKDKQIENLKNELEKIKSMCKMSESTSINNYLSNSNNKQNQTIPKENDGSSPINSNIVPAKKISHLPNFKLDLKGKVDKVSSPELYSERINNSNSILNKHFSTNLGKSLLNSLKEKKLNSTSNSNNVRKSNNNTNKTSFVQEKEHNRQSKEKSREKEHSGLQTPSGLNKIHFPISSINQTNTGSLSQISFKHKSLHNNTTTSSSMNINEMSSKLNQIKNRTLKMLNIYSENILKK